MAPSATDEQPAAAKVEEKTYPPAKIYPVTETKFEKYVAPDSEGRKKALQQNGNAAIVIDNGEFGIPLWLLRRRARKLARPARGKQFSGSALTPLARRILCRPRWMVV